MYLKVTLVLFSNQFNKDVSYNEANDNNLFQFAYDIYFKPPPDTIVIENPFNCTPVDLKPCTLNDGLSCVGCKSLIATCIHFNEDTKYIDYNGIETIIPANLTENDGYCLTQMNTNQRCNPFHGDLVLVQANPDALESMLYCNCKNPGYIGNIDILGACEEPFICNGKIDDINQPIEKIQCLCENDTIPVTNNNVPSCIIPSVKEFTQFNNATYFDGIYTVPKDRFTDDIAKNFPGDKLRNPCKYCLLTGVYLENGEMKPADDGGYQCVTFVAGERGLPIRRDPNRRILKGDKGPDAIVDVKVHSLLVHGYLNETEFEQMTALLHVSDNRSILQFINVPVDKDYAYINLKDHQLVFPESFGAMTVTSFPGTYCDGPEVWGILWEDFLYYCYFSNSIPYDRHPRGHNNFTTQYAPLLKFDTAPDCPPKHHGLFSSGSFHKWEEYEGHNSAHFKSKVNELIKYEIKQGFKSDTAIKYIFSMYNFTNGKSNHYGTSNRSIYDKWFAITIPKNN